MEKQNAHEKNIAHDWDIAHDWGIVGKQDFDVSERFINLENRLETIEKMLLSTQASLTNIALSLDKDRHTYDKNKVQYLGWLRDISLGVERNSHKRSLFWTNQWKYRNLFE